VAQWAAGDLGVRTHSEQGFSGNWTRRECQTNVLLVGIKEPNWMLMNIRNDKILNVSLGVPENDPEICIN
jgi:hypothetical protein